MIESIIAKKNAGQNPATANPGTNFPARIIIRRALITSEKSPSVTMVIGRVKILIIGLMNTLISAHTIAKTRAPTNVTSIPGTKYAATKIEIAEISQCVMFM